MKLEIDHTRLLEETLDAPTRFIVHRGGSSSSKTYSICQALILWCIQNTGLTIDVYRKTFPALRTSAMKDFFDNLHQMQPYDTETLDCAELYELGDHVKTLNTYMLNGNTVQFGSLDDPQKAHGPRRDILWLNEANDLTYSDYHQLAMRTRLKVIIDFNPKEPPEHWITTEVLSLPPDKVTVIDSTYLDNPFMPDGQREMLERLKDTDPALWSVYGLGKYVQIRGKIYTNREQVSVIPPGGVYGIDFGHTNPTAVIRCLLQDNTLFWDEILYETHMTNADLISRLKAQGIPQGSILYCDAAEPDRIEELRRAGFDARMAKKDVKTGIDFCQRFPIRYSGANIGKEIASYKWKENRYEEPLDEPLKYNDHAMDAARYGTFSHYFVPNEGPKYESLARREKW